MDADQLREENARLRRSVAELSLLNELAVAVSNADDLEGVVAIIVQRALQAVSAEQGVISLVEHEEREQRTLVRKLNVSQAGALRPDDTLLGWMMGAKRLLVLNEPRVDSRFTGANWDDSIRTVMCAPLLAKGRLIGILTVYNKMDGDFDEGDGRLLTIMAAQSAQVIANVRLSEERNQVIRIFGQYTSPAIVDELLLHDAQWNGERKDVCVMFFDVRGFSGFAEKHDPEDVVAFLNKLFEVTISAVIRHHGTVHQLLGDGFMAIFGAPVAQGNHCDNAVRAAISIAREVEAVLPDTQIGIGLHAGEVVAGTIGSAEHREYKVTGDVVNVAARIEQLNKEYDSVILLSEAVLQKTEDPSIAVSEIGEVIPRGRTEPVAIFQIL